MPIEFKRYPVDKVRTLVQEIYRGMGATSDEVEILEDQIVHGAMRTHPGQGQGLEKLPRVWERLMGGTILPGAPLEVIKEGPAWSHIDGHRGWGIVIAAKAMDIACEKAKKFGLGMVVVRHSNHLGTCQYHAMRALKHGLIGLCMTNAGPEMAPWGGITPMLGTNPWGVAVPNPDFPVVLDMALSQSGKGMVRWHMVEGKPIPRNWAYAPDGSETEDPELAMQGPLVPMGEFKGTGLSLITDVLTGVMSGGAFGTTPYSDPKNHDVSHLLLAIDPACYIELDQFGGRMQAFQQELKSSKLKPGVDEIFLPGEMEHRRQQEAERHGMPIAVDTVAALARLCVELQVPFGLEG